jgi:hypothetical protein
MFYDPVCELNYAKREARRYIIEAAVETALHILIKRVEIPLGI